MRVAPVREASLRAAMPLADTPQEELQTVTCVFRGQFQPDFHIYNKDLYIESSYRVWDEIGEIDKYYFYVPAGTYDVATYFWGAEGGACIVHEEVVVDGPVTVEFHESEVTEVTYLKPMLSDGQEAILAFAYDDEELDNPNAGEEVRAKSPQLDTSRQNIRDLALNYAVFLEGCKPFLLGSFFADCESPGRPTGYAIRSNRLSDRYRCAFQYLLRDLDGDYQLSTTVATGVNGGTLESWHEGYVPFPVPEYAETPIFRCDEGTLQSCVFTDMWIYGVDYGGVGFYSIPRRPGLIVALQPTGPEIDVKSPVAVWSVQAELELWDPWEEKPYIEPAEIVPLPALYTENGWEYINQNHSACGEQAFQVPESGPILNYPGFGPYSYMASGLTQPLANSCPMCVVRCVTEKYEDMDYFGFIPQAYIGRFGEVRRCDQYVVDTEVRRNGEVVFDSADGGYLEEWCVDNSFDGHEKGIIDATFVDPNVLVDGKVSGSNQTTVRIDERNEDRCAPTLQMLIFRDTEGAITDRFDSPSEGILEFSAGDFNYIESGRHYVCDPIDLKVEYAPYGEEEYRTLEVAEIPENFYMPGFGYFYRGSLGSVTGSSSNGWYDLRFTLEDRAGNRMVQTVSPAFRIGEGLGLDTPTSRPFAVRVERGRLTVEGCDCESIRIFAPDGRLVAVSGGSSVDAGGYVGMAVVVVRTKEGEVRSRKIDLR